MNATGGGITLDSVGNDLNANLDISTAGGSTTTITTAAPATDQLKIKSASDTCTELSTSQQMLNLTGAAGAIGDATDTVTLDFAIKKSVLAMVMALELHCSTLSCCNSEAIPQLMLVPQISTLLA